MAWYNPISWFSSSEKAVDTACDIAKDISSGIDVMFYTEEEKAQASQKATETWLKLFEIEKDASGVRAVTRRWIAIIMVAQWVLMLNVGLGFLLFGMADEAKEVFNIMTAVTAAVSVILSFYFGPNQIARAIKSVKK